jgi:hypothetical protein
MARAAVVSIRRMRADGSGLRTVAPTSMPGRRRSDE